MRRLTIDIIRKTYRTANINETVGGHLALEDCEVCTRAPLDASPLHERDSKRGSHQRVRSACFGVPVSSD